MADPNSLSEIGKVGAGVAAGGGLALLLTQVLGGLLKGWLSGTAGQEKELRAGQAERLVVLEKKVEDLERRLEAGNRTSDGWRYLCLQARIEAEKLGYDRTLWPADPPTGGTP